MKTAFTIVLTLGGLVAGWYVCTRIFSKKRVPEKPLTTLVFLLDSHRKLSEQEVRTAAETAFGVTFDAGNPDATEFVFGFEPPVPGGWSRSSAPAGRRGF